MMAEMNLCMSLLKQQIVIHNYVSMCGFMSLSYHMSQNLSILFTSVFVYDKKLIALLFV